MAPEFGKPIHQLPLIPAAVLKKHCVHGGTGRCAAPKLPFLKGVSVRFRPPKPPSQLQRSAESCRTNVGKKSKTSPMLFEPA